MTGKFADWDLIWCFLELENLLVDELALLVDNDEGIRSALDSILTDWLRTELLECDASKSTLYELLVDCAALLAFCVDDCGLRTEDTRSDDDTWHSNQSANSQCV